MLVVRRISFILALATLCVLSVHPALAQCVSLTTLGSAATQNFDTLINTAGSTTNALTITATPTALPSCWIAFEMSMFQ